MALIVGPMSAKAQDSDVQRIGEGSRVQVTRLSDVRAWTGTVVTRHATGIVVAPDRAPWRAPEVVDWRTMERLSVGQRRPATEGLWRGAVRGLVIGGLLTIAATGISAGTSADERCDGCTLSPTMAVAAIGSALTLGFTIGGALIGAAAPGERWLPVRLDR